MQFLRRLQFLRRTHGSGWQIFGAWLLVTLMAFVLALVVVMVMMAVNPEYTETYLDAELGSMEDLQGQAWIEIAVQVPLQALGATMMAVAYFLLRKGKENIDAKEIAAVFD